MIESSRIVVLERETDIYLVCEVASRLASDAGFDRYRCADIETAVSEICTNALRHADDGWASLRLLSTRFEVVVTDRGPGFGGRRRSASGLGIGLKGAGRLMGDLTITPLPNGSRVTMSRPLPVVTGGDTGVWSVRTVIRAKASHTVSGDAAIAIENGDGSVRVALADGLGSGPDAAVSAERVLEAIHKSNSKSPAEALQMAHAAVGDTRGAAVTAVWVSENGEGLHAGLGDVACLISRPGLRLPSRPGIVGTGSPTTVDTAFSMEPDAGMFLWTDGMRINGEWQRPTPTGSELAWMEGVVMANSDRRDDAALMILRRRNELTSR